MFIESLKLKGILSFRDTELELRPLNVLIGPNGSGKSNLIEVIGLLRALPQGDGLRKLTSEGAGVAEWLWAGESPPFRFGAALVRGVFQLPASQAPLQYELGFKAQDTATDGNSAADIFVERLHFQDPDSGAGVTFDRNRQPSFSGATPSAMFLNWHHHNPNFARTAGPLAEGLEHIRIYRELGLGPSMASKSAQPTDKLGDFLEEDGSNLFLVLNRMELDGSREQVEEHFKHFYEPFQRSSIQFHADGAQLAIKERSLSSFTYANRLSDGTVRYLCLLAILCHPNPPPLICIEEPEVGLHPDILRDVALLLLEAAERTQLIVTTHSDILIDALSGDPETVVVCERDPDMGTSFERLSAKKLNLWLEEFKLGELWRTGEIGGVRW